jgi:hypothetical protein
VLIAFSIFWLSACDDDDPASPGGEARIEGRVTDNTGFNVLAKVAAPVDSATVNVLQLQSDGSVDTVSMAEVQTDANGEFTLLTDVDGERHLVVVATKGSAEWRAVVSSEVSDGATVSCQPLNEETTLEADVFEAVVINGQEVLVAYTDISSYLDVEVTENLQGDAAATDLYTALAAESNAQDQTLTDSTVGASQDQLDAVRVARTQAQATLEASLLAAAGDQTQIDAAFAEFRQADVDAFVTAGIAVESYARAKEVSTKALAKNSTGLAADAQFALNKSTALRKSFVIDQAVQQTFIALGANTAQMTPVITAGTTLRSSLQAATSAGDIDAAFQAYHDAIVAELQVVASVYAASISTMDTSINSAAGLRFVLGAAVNLVGTEELLVNAYTTFFTSVGALVDTTLGSATDAEVTAISNALILINMQV